MAMIPFHRIQSILGFIFILGVDLLAIQLPAGADASSIRLIIQEATIVHTEVTAPGSLTHQVTHQVISNPVEITYFKSLHPTTMERSITLESQTFLDWKLDWKHVVQENYTLTGYRHHQAGQATQRPQP